MIGMDTQTKVIHPQNVKDVVNGTREKSGAKIVNGLLFAKQISAKLKKIYVIQECMSENEI